MTWLYVPEISSHCAQASAAWNSASTSLSDIGERLAAASVTWREKPQPPQAWSRRWKQGGFIRLLSGVTCEPSTADAGVDTWISSHLAIPASPPEHWSSLTLGIDLSKNWPWGTWFLPSAAGGALSPTLCAGRGQAFGACQGRGCRASSQPMDTHSGQEHEPKFGTTHLGGMSETSVPQRGSMPGRSEMAHTSSLKSSPPSRTWTSPRKPCGSSDDGSRTGGGSSASVEEMASCNGSGAERCSSVPASMRSKICEKGCAQPVSCGGRMSSGLPCDSISLTADCGIFWRTSGMALLESASLVGFLSYPKRKHLRYSMATSVVMGRAVVCVGSPPLSANHLLSASRCSRSGPAALSPPSISPTSNRRPRSRGESSTSGINTKSVSPIATDPLSLKVITDGSYAGNLSAPGLAKCSISASPMMRAMLQTALSFITARKIPTPESAPGPRESDSSPRKSAGSPKSAGLVLSSARTSQGTRTDSLKPSSLHWKRWATALRQEYLARPKPATPCGASDCSSWPSAKVASGKWERDQNGNVYPTMEGAAATWEAPSVAVTEGSRLTRSGERADELLLTGQAIKASEWMAPVADDTGTRTKCYAQGGTPLSLQTSNWSSPKASDPEKAGPNMRGSKGDVPLPGQAVNWAAPAAQNHKGSSEGSSEGSITRADGKSREDILSYQAEQFFHPPSSPDRPIAGGSMSSTDSPNSNQLSVKRRLNPYFVEALMRWPTGLSGFERQAMALIPSQPPTRSSASPNVLERWFAIQSAYLQALLLGLPQGEGQLDMFGSKSRE